MGVDFYTCTYCDETYPDCGDYFACDCGINYCCYKCGDGKTKDNESIDNCVNFSYKDEKTCRICRNEYVTDYHLLDYLLKVCRLTREEAQKLYIEHKMSITKDKCNTNFEM